MNKLVHYTLLVVLSLSILLLVMFNYYVLFEMTKGFDIDNTEWSYTREVINPHIFKLFYVYLFILCGGLLSLFFKIIYKLKKQMPIYVILFSVIGLMNIYSIEYFEIPRLLIEANRSSSNQRSGLEYEIVTEVMGNDASNYNSKEYKKTDTSYSYHQKVKEVAPNRQYLLSFDSLFISNEETCDREKVIEMIKQFSKEESYDYFNSGAINQFYKCFDFPKSELQKFPFTIKTNKRLDSLAIHTDHSNATIYLTANQFEKHILLEEELNACGFGGVSGYWFDSNKDLLNILMYVTRYENGCLSGLPPCVRTFYTQTIKVDTLY
jgi:hypothetical protein